MIEKKIVYCKRCGKRKYSTLCKSKECTAKWKKPKKTKPTQFKPKGKITGELALFMSLWATRKRICFISGQPLTQFNVTIFCHVLPKGAYKHYRLYDQNIVLMTPENLPKQHSMAKSDLIKENENWQKFFTLQDEMRIEYNKKFK